MKKSAVLFALVLGLAMTPASRTAEASHYVYNNPYVGHHYGPYYYGRGYGYRPYFYHPVCHIGGLNPSCRAPYRKAYWGIARAGYWATRGAFRVGVAVGLGAIRVGVAVGRGAARVAVFGRPFYRHW